MWENYVIAERMKLLSYNDIDARLYFWRTTQQQEIDLVEDNDGRLKAVEIKWGKNAKVRFSQTFLENYKGVETFIVSPENIDEYLIM